MKFKKFTLYDLSSKDVTSLHVCEINLFQEPATGSDFRFLEVFVFSKKIQMFCTPSKFQNSETGGVRECYTEISYRKNFFESGPVRAGMFFSGPDRAAKKFSGPGRAATKISGPGRATFENILRAGPGHFELSRAGPGQHHQKAARAGPGGPAPTSVSDLQK